ncbi:CDHR1-like protein [Mya arenaria]|uniref:CDHR1-like protein n=1 Tax=Mya arenaria TaxID=6604 RepID=A0ABY7DGE6_MYAAR|nr:CDHR1-like protein [Mya arenaria]
MELPLLWVLLLLFFRECESEPHPPVIVDNTDAAVVVSEDTKIGTVLWTLKAMDEDGDDVIIGYPEYEAESKTLIDVLVDLVISDVNDEVPVFQNLPYRLQIPEPITQSDKDAVVFTNTFSMDPKTASIFLKAPLDYEKMQFYQFKIIAVDGYGLNSSEVLTIRILDIQDTPPEVQGTPYVVTVQENSPLGKHFFTCRAIDGDRGIPNEVAFSFSTETPCQSLFAINETSGEITVSGDVDRDFGDVMEHGGVCNMEIFVREIEQPAHAQFGLTESRAALSVFVTDENDNAPSISADSFRAYIDNTAELNYPIQFENDTEIFIEDKDQGSSGILELVLRGEDGDMTYDFEPIPSVIASRGAPLIALKSPDLIKRRGNITLKLYAIERDTAERNSATAVIHIRVTPGSKKQPHRSPECVHWQRTSCTEHGSAYWAPASGAKWRTDRRGLDIHGDAAGEGYQDCLQCVKALLPREVMP